MLKFENVSKVFDGFKAVDAVNMTVNEGEFLVVIGPSGSGKSTTMKMINRMIPHSSGKILIDGQDIEKLNPAKLRRNIGYVIQQIGLFPHYTIRDNIAIVPQLKGWSEQEIKDRVRELMILVGLDPEIYLDRYPKELSGGQQQRVGVARALASNPEVILMGEPFGALDPSTRDQLAGELISLQRKLKKTLVCVTHDMAGALRLGDRTALLQGGKSWQCHTPERLLYNPTNGFIEEFCGKHHINQHPELMPVANVMTTTVGTFHNYRSPEKALSVTRKKKITHLIIVDEDHSIVGMLDAYELANRVGKIQTIEEIMFPPEYTLSEADTAKDAIFMMKKVSYGIIPVLDEDDKVIGLVTRGSLLAVLSSQWTDVEEDQ